MILTLIFLMSAAPLAPAAPCQFGRGAAVPEASTWMEQFKCYQSSGRRVSVVGAAGFDARFVSGGLCLQAVARDRVQVAACGSFAGDSAMIVSYSTIAFVVDDPRQEAVGIHLTSFR